MLKVAPHGKRALKAGFSPIILEGVAMANSKSEIRNSKSAVRRPGAEIAGLEVASEHAFLMVDGDRFSGV